MATSQNTITVLLDTSQYPLNNLIGTGGEGDVYQLSDSLAVKVYHADRNSNERRLKVLALCNSYKNNIKRFGGASFAFPHTAAYLDKKQLDCLCGFGMRFLGLWPKLVDISYDINNGNFRAHRQGQLNDNTAVQLIYKVFELVSSLHKARIILGDINPRNFLYNLDTHAPLVIDLDSAQVGLFRCLAWSPEYIDPLIEVQGKNASGGYTYNFEADNFSLTCMLFEFIVGAHPYSVGTKPALKIPEKKTLGVSYLSLLHSKGQFPSGIAHVARLIDDLVGKRLEYLRRNYTALYDFFVSTLMENKRASLVETLERSDPRHPAYIFFSRSGFPIALEEWKSRVRSARHQAPTPAQIRRKVGIDIPDSGFEDVIVGGRFATNTAAKVPRAAAQAATVDSQIFAPGFANSRGASAHESVTANSAVHLSDTLVTKRRDPQQLAMFLGQYRVNWS